MAPLPLRKCRLSFGGISNGSPNWCVLRIVPERKWLDALEERGYLGPLDRGSRADGNHTGKIQVAPSRFDGGT